MKPNLLKIRVIIFNNNFELTKRYAIHFSHFQGVRYSDIFSPLRVHMSCAA